MAKSKERECVCVRVRRILSLLPSVFSSRAWREEEEEIPGSILFLMSEELFGRIDTPVFFYIPFTPYKVISRHQ